MKLDSLQAQDIVLVSKGGRRFHARVTGVRSGVVEFVPIERGISYRRASARDVIDLWRHRRSKPIGDDPELEFLPPAVSQAQLSLAGRLDTSPTGRG